MAKTCKKINVFNSQYKHVLKPPFIICVIAGMFAAACFMGNSFPSMLGPKRKIIIKNSTFLKFKQNSFHPCTHFSLQISVGTTLPVNSWKTNLPFFCLPWKLSTALWPQLGWEILSLEEVGWQHILFSPHPRLPPSLPQLSTWTEDDCCRPFWKKYSSSCLPGFFGSSWHEWRTISGTLLSTTNTASDKQDALFL